MDFGQFRQRFDTLRSLEERTAALLEFGEGAMQSCTEELEPLLERTAEECRSAGLSEPAAYCDRLLGWLAFDCSDYPRAQRRFEEALAAFDALKNRPGRLKALNGIASVLSDTGRHEIALRTYRDALALATELGDRDQTFVLRSNIGETLAKIGRYREAEPYFREAIDSGRLSPLNQALTLKELAGTLVPQVRTEEARTALVRAVAISRENGFLQALAMALDALGALDLEPGGRIAEGTRAILEEARAVARQARDRATEARSLLDLGRLRLAGGEGREALALFDEALMLSRAIGTEPLEAAIWKRTTEARKALGEWKEALGASERYHALTERLHDESVSRQVAQIRADQIQRETELLLEQTRVLTLLGELGQRITASLDLETIMITLYDSIGGLFKAEIFGLGLYRPERGSIQYPLFMESGARMPPMELSLRDPSFSAWCIEHRKPLRLGNVRKEYGLYIPAMPERQGDKTKTTLSCLYAPLLAEGEVLGVLSAQSYQENAYSERDLATFITLASSISVAVQNARLFERITQLATVDSLTGAATRRHLFERAEEEFQRSIREGSPLALAMIDLDHFKELNDTWGHAVGDRVLAEFGALCIAHKRPHDLFGRYGGEEFALLLSGATLEGAVSSAERLCEKIAALPLSAPDGAPIVLTASFGVTAFGPEDQDITRVFSRADEALYEAKLAGRNRVSSRSA
jgi:diguanylate cyclase (GGDEF)-like protein